MIEIKAFKALMPKKELAEKVACPPYDVVSSQKAREIVSQNPLSFLSVKKGESNFSYELDPYSDEAYNKSKEMMDEFLEKGILFYDKTPSIFIYKQINKGHTQIGIAAGVLLKNYEDGKIKKHELTRKAPLADRMKIIDTLSCQTGPVFLFHNFDQKLDELIKNCIETMEPIFNFTDNAEVSHTMWKIEDPEIITKIEKIFQTIDALYVADGHHRLESAYQNSLKRKDNKEAGYVMAFVFPHTHLQILGYHRIIKDLNNLSKEEFIEKLKENFTLELLKGERYPEKPLEFIMAINNSWYSIIPKEREKLLKDRLLIDSHLLTEMILSPILAIHDIRADKRIDFIGGADALEKIKTEVYNKNAKAGFLLYPVTVEKVMAISDENKIMPPKSTWFEPKLASGLIAHPF